MELIFKNNQIVLEKELNTLDEFVIKFVDVLNELNIKNVLISGYVSILFGRNRSSEDIDILIERLDYEAFKKLWKKLDEFECLQSPDPEESYNQYLNDDHAIRFSLKGDFIPNMEVKFPKIALENWALDNRVKVILNGKILHISPIELQIAFKLYLSSEKDIEDSKYLYNLFKNNIDLNILDEFNHKLKVDEAFTKYLK